MEYTKSEAKAYCREHMTGVWTALTTPFTPSGELDEEGLRQIVRTCIDDLHIDGFFCNGLMGEYWSLSPKSVSGFSTSSARRAGEARRPSPTPRTSTSKKRSSSPSTPRKWGRITPS